MLQEEEVLHNLQKNLNQEKTYKIFLIEIIIIMLHREKIFKKIILNLLKTFYLMIINYHIILIYQENLNLMYRSN